jgi:hypothetical protein
MENCYNFNTRNIKPITSQFIYSQDAPNQIIPKKKKKKKKLIVVIKKPRSHSRRIVEKCEIKQRHRVFENYFTPTER